MSTKARVEIFKFGCYVFFPISIFYYFNLPEFYDKNVLPDVARVHPQGLEIPHTREGNLELLEKLKRKRKADNQASAPTSQ